MKISAVIIAFNEEKNIRAAIESVGWADEILVVDSESTDKTREIAEGAGATVVIQPWLGFSAQKQFAIDMASNDWILSLDADERVSIPLREEILKLESNAEGFTMPRLSIYMNREIRHGGWYPDRQLRLFDRRKGKWKDVAVHESFQMIDSATIGKLNGDILHYSVENAEHHHRMIGERYAPLAAKQMFADGRRTSFLKVMSAGLAAFARSYILKLGFLDGLPGFCIARFAAHHAFMKHLLLWEIQSTGRDYPYQPLHFYSHQTFRIASECVIFLLLDTSALRYMKRIIFLLGFVLVISFAVNAQKGIDTQTEKIKQDTNKTTRATDATRSFNWGKGKTEVRDRLPNPYKLNSRRDVLLSTIREALKERKILVDEASSRLGDGVVITQPFIFSKGPVITQNELNRYGVLQFADTAWSRGRFTLTIEVQSIDGIQNNVTVNAKIEGRAGNGLTTEWTTVQSSGLAEDEFLATLVEMVTGNSIEPVQDIEKP